MDIYKKILVVLRREHDKQLALEHAEKIAHHTGADLTLFACLYHGSSVIAETLLGADRQHSAEEFYVHETKQWLESLAEGLRDKGLHVDVDVRWESPRYAGIIHKAVEDGHDLVVKSTRVHSKTSSVFFTPTDWSLLRKCPVPVLLAKPAQWRPNGRILAAVDPMQSHDKPSELNESILHHAKAWADKVGSELHVVHSYNSLLPYLNAYADPADIDIHRENICKHHAEQLHLLLADYQIPEDRIHLREGIPDEIIPELAEELDVDLVVMGTICRTGVVGMLIGNTAEDVLDKINSDVLALKPEGFVPPMDL